MKKENGPIFKAKIAFWIVLALLSVFFAEVLSGSEPFAMVIPWNPIVLMPLYGIHTLLLATLVFKGKPTFTSLFAAGCIFGLYEAYITKVLFNPHWGASPFRYLGVDFLWILILVLWWHAFFAFIIPLFTGEVLLTNSNEISRAFPKRIRKILSKKKGFTILLLILTIWAALFMGSNIPGIVIAPVALAVDLVVITLAVLAYRKWIGTRYSMRELLPEGKEFWVLFSILMFMYLLFGVIWAPDRMPGPAGHLIIFGSYLLFFVLLYMNMKRSRFKEMRSSGPVKWKIGYRKPILFFGIYSIIAVIVGITGIGIVFILLSFLFGVILGIFCLVRTIIEPLKGPWKK